MLRLRTAFSFRHAAGKLEEIANRLQENKATIAPITDRGSAFGWANWTKVCDKAGIRPIYGVELAVTTAHNRANDKRLNADHFTFLAKKDLTEINRLINLASSQSWYESLLFYEDVARMNGSVIRIAGSAVNLDMIKREPDMYVSLSPSSPIGLIKRAIAKKFPLVACYDNRYPRIEDKVLYEVVCGRNARLQSYPQHILSDKEWIDAVEHLASPKLAREALARARDVAAQSVAVLPKGELLHPRKPMTLRAMCEAGAKKFGVNLKSNVYADRLERELKLIEEKKFENYFYIIADMVNWAKDHMLVGPARGSSCGSLVCYLLGITTVDPLKYGLLFERFIDTNRNDLPDIDIDFSDVQRDKVLDYMGTKYGKDHVARLGTVAVFRPRSALTEAGIAFGIPKWKTERVAEALIVRSSADSRALDTLEDTLGSSDAGKQLLAEFPEAKVATRMEGHPRHHSQHAAGILLTQRPIINYLPTDAESGCVHADKKGAESLGLLKIDALGLTQLSVFEDIFKMIKKPHDFLYSIPLDDPAVFKDINDRKYAGIFQFNGMALQSLSKVVNITELNDLVAITALARPGPMASGGASAWVRRKNGTEPVSFPHPVFEPYLRETMGIMTYQEQVMQIGREIGDLSWEDVTALRKAMSASLGVEFFNRYGDRWKAGAVRKGIPRETLDKIWDDMCAYGSWSFNKSHAVAYGIVSYYCCWLKHYYPYEFAAATLTHEGTPEKQLKLLRELNDEGIGYIPVDVNISTDRWQVVRKGEDIKLLGPLSMIRGMGPAKVDKWMTYRALKKRNKDVSIDDNIAKMMASPKTDIDSLWPIRDAFKRVMPDPRERNIHTPSIRICDIVEEDHDCTGLIYCIFKKIDLKDENEAVKIAARGGKVIRGEPTASLNLFLTDDTGTIFGKISRWIHADLGVPIVTRGAPGKHLYAVKGTFKINGDFTMMLINQVKYIGPVKGEIANVT